MPPRPRALLYSALLSLALLLLAARSANAATGDPCTPPADGTAHCHLPVQSASPWFWPLAADASFVYAKTWGPDTGAPSLRVLMPDAAGTLAARGHLALNATEAVVDGGFLYATAESPGLWTVSVAHPDFPVVRSVLPLTATIHSLTLADGALYALTSAPPVSSTFALSESAATTLLVFERANPAAPQLHAALPAASLLQIARDGETLIGASARGLALFDVSEPLAPLLLTTTVVFTEPVSAVEVQPQQGLAYLLARSADGTPRCHVLDLRQPHRPHATGSCPFVAGRTFFTPAFAYVNPNESPAEYLDYAIYALSDPAQPRRVAVETSRFRALRSAGPRGPVYAARFDRTIAQLLQTENGLLVQQATTWTPESAEVVGEPVLVADGRLFLRRSSDPSHGAVLVVADLAHGTPRRMGQIVSPLLNTSDFQVRAGQLLSLRGSRLSLFDIRDPARALLLSELVPPAGEAIARYTFGGDGRVYAATETNQLLVFDIRQPSAARMEGLLAFHGAPRALVWAAGYLYLFGDDTLFVIDVRVPARPAPVRTLPVTPGVASVYGYANALFVVRKGLPSIELLRIDRPGTPQPVPAAALAELGAGVDRILSVADGLLFVVHREARATAPGSASHNAPAAEESSRYAVTTFDLANPLQPRAVARWHGLDGPDGAAGGDLLVLSGLFVYTIGRAQAVTQAVASPAEPVVFQPTTGLTYTLAAGAFAAVPPGRAVCLRHSTDRNAPRTLFPERALYAGLHRLETFDCETGAPLLPSGSALVTVAYPANAGSRAWDSAEIMLFAGDGWLPAARAANDGVERLTADLMPYQTWAVRGEPPPPAFLPYAGR